MKKLLILIILLTVSTTSFGWSLNPFGKKEEVKEEINKGPSVCYYSMNITRGIHHMFKGGCEGFEHVGIVDLLGNKIIVIKDLKKAFESGDFPTPDAREAFMEKQWPSIIPVEFGNVK